MFVVVVVVGVVVVVVLIRQFALEQSELELLESGEECLINTRLLSFARSKGAGKLSLAV